jgi:hypothetical protein
MFDVRFLVNPLYETKPKWHGHLMFKLVAFQASGGAESRSFELLNGQVKFYHSLSPKCKHRFLQGSKSGQIFNFILTWLLHALPELVYVPIISWIFSCIWQRMCPAPSVLDRTK